MAYILWKMGLRKITKNYLSINDSWSDQAISQRATETSTWKSKLLRLLQRIWDTEEQRQNTHNADTERKCQLLVMPTEQLIENGHQESTSMVLKTRLVFKYNEYIELTILQHKPSQIYNFWCTSEVLAMPGFPAIMSRDTFPNITTWLTTLMHHWYQIKRGGSTYMKCNICGMRHTKDNPQVPQGNTSKLRKVKEVISEAT